MIDVALLSVIRRWQLREGVSIREIAWRTQLSRNTIRRYLADGTPQPAYPKRSIPDTRFTPHSGHMVDSAIGRRASVRRC